MKYPIPCNAPGVVSFLVQCHVLFSSMLLDTTRKRFSLICVSLDSMSIYGIFYVHRLCSVVH